MIPENGKSLNLRGIVKFRRKILFDLVLEAKVRGRGEMDPPRKGRVKIEFGIIFRFVVLPASTDAVDQFHLRYILFLQISREGGVKMPKRLRPRKWDSRI